MTRTAIFLAGCALCVMACGATFTLPSTDEAPGQCANGGTLTGLRYVIVHACRQSPTWVAKRDSMLAYPAAWERYWPLVRAEADIHTLSRTPIDPALAGKRYTFTPSLPWHPAFVSVSTEDDSGNVSCHSNWRWVP